MGGPCFHGMSEFPDSLCMNTISEVMQQANFLDGSGADSTAGQAGDSVLIRDMPAHEYHADRDALSCSLLKPLLISPAHFQAALLAHNTSSDAMDFGTLVHLLVLQPREVANEVAVFPGVANRRKEEYKQFEAKFTDRLIVDEPTFASARRVAGKVMDTRHKGRRLQLFMEESIMEATIYFTEPTTGLRMRIRMDAFHPDITFDLKSTRFGAPRAFARDALDKDYDLQAIIYSLGQCLYEGSKSPKPFVFIAAETCAPHSVSTLAASSAFLDNGAKKFQACVGAFQACTETGYWPDLGSDGELEIEPWQQFTAQDGWRESLCTR